MCSSDLIVHAGFAMGTKIDKFMFRKGFLELFFEGVSGVITGYGYFHLASVIKQLRAMQ